MSPVFSFSPSGALRYAPKCQAAVCRFGSIFVQRLGGLKMQQNNSPEFQNNPIRFDDPVDSFNSAPQAGPKQHVYRAARPKTKNRVAGSIYEWLDVVIASVIAVVVIFTFIFRIAAIDGDSMKNTLFDKERVIISDLFYTPRQGDMVVISRNTDNSAVEKDSQKPIIKRVIATAGQTVNIDFTAGTVTVDGKLLQENYIREATHRQFDIEFPVRVPENCIFVMGDNRNESLDSRSSQIGENGMINTKYVLGHAVFRIYPFNRIGTLG